MNILRLERLNLTYKIFNNSMTYICYVELSEMFDTHSGLKIISKKKKHT